MFLIVRPNRWKFLECCARAENPLKSWGSSWAAAVLYDSLQNSEENLISSFVLVAIFYGIHIPPLRIQ